MRWLSTFAAALGGALLLLNAYGIALAPDGAKAFAVRKNDSTISSAEAWRAIRAARQERDPARYVTGLTLAVHERVANPLEADVYGKGAMAPRVEENWPLWLLNLASGGRFNNYEYQTPAAALRRGLGTCGAQAIVLARLLEQDGQEPTLRGSRVHMTAKVGDWWLDPDYGVVLRAKASNEEIAKAYAGKAPADVMIEHFSARPQVQDVNLLAGVRYPLDHFFGLEPQVFEAVTVWVKWGLPAFLVAVGVLFLVLPRRRA